MNLALERLGIHDGPLVHFQAWGATKLVICDLMNLVVILMNIFLVDWYLGHQFFLFGVESFRFMATSVSLRGIDPFNLLFPKMTKCTLNM